MGLQDGHGVLAHLAARQARGERELLHEEVHEVWNIVPPLGEGRNPDRHHRETVEEILPEKPLLDRQSKIPACRRNDPHIHMYAGRAANALEILVHQDPQDLSLGLLGHVRDFIEIEGAAMGLLQGADLARAPIRAFGPEELFFHGLRRDRRGVENDEGTAGPQRGLVDRADDQFLAGAGRA